MQITLNQALDQILNDSKAGKQLSSHVAVASGLDNDTITIELGGGSVIYERLEGQTVWKEVPTIPIAGSTFK